MRTVKDSENDNQKLKRSRNYYFRLGIGFALVSIGIMILIAVISAISGSSEKTIMAPGPTGSTNSIEKPLT
jgi:hypothetical protein